LWELTTSFDELGGVLRDSVEVIWQGGGWEEGREDVLSPWSLTLLLYLLRGA